jgi:hypothetical protein
MEMLLEIVVVKQSITEKVKQSQRVRHPPKREEEEKAKRTKINITTITKARKTKTKYYN